MYQQQKRYNTAMDRFSDVKFGMASYIKWERAGVARAASSCNAFAIATFSSSLVYNCATRRRIAGPHICGDSLDIDPVNSHILTGSWRKDNSLQVSNSRRVLC